MSLNRQDGSAQDVVVIAEPTATVRDVASRIAAADPRHAYDTERRYTLQTASPVDPEWRLLPPDAVIGDEWLASGLSVALVDEADAADLLPSLHAGVSATLTILNGPQTGHSVVLGRGSHTIGRNIANIEFAVAGQSATQVAVQRQLNALALRAAAFEGGMIVGGQTANAAGSLEDPLPWRVGGDW